MVENFFQSNSNLWRWLLTYPEDSKSVSYFRLFQFATPWQKCFVGLSFVLAAIGSVGPAAIAVLDGEYFALLIDRTKCLNNPVRTTFMEIFGGGRTLTNGTTEENRVAIVDDALAYLYGNLAILGIQFVFISSAITLVNYVALQQVNTIRKLFFKSLIRQEIGWFDLNSRESVASRITEDLEKIKEGIGEKLIVFLYLMFSATLNLVVAWVNGWKLTLVILSFAPLIIISTGIASIVQTQMIEDELKEYSIASSIVEEVLGAIRTVYAFSGQKKEVSRYDENLATAETKVIKKGLYSGLCSGIMWLSYYLSHAIGVWYGVPLVIHGTDGYTAASVLIILVCLLTTSQNVGQTVPYFEMFNSAQGAAVKIYTIIGRKSSINALNKGGAKPKNLKGNIEFDNAYFCYPSRRDVQALNGLSLNIKSGQTVALVGPSGCGKSTVIQLIQRFYDLDKGTIKVDRMNLTSLNVATLRSNIGLVGQEPVLFDTTIAENIRYGKPDATFEEVVEAAKTANCHEFIAKLPDGYETRVGQRGSQFSGGQKQRIAIARAIIRNPSILLLDEATSALDTNSEKKVQAALDRVSEGRTTVVVSHRLSTIVNADKIYYMNEGQVVEEGTHAELLEAKGKYWELVMAQSYKESEKVTDESKRVHEADKCEKQSNADSNEEILAAEEKKQPISILRLIKLNAPEGWYLSFAFIAVLIVSICLPTDGVLFGGFIGVLTENDKEVMIAKTNLYSILFVAFGVIMAIAMFVQTYFFNIAGARLTRRLRRITFTSMMKQEIAWYDEAQNNTGKLSARLSEDCAQIQNVLGTPLGYIVQAILVSIIGPLIAFYFSWRLAIVAIWSTPVIIFLTILDSVYSRKSAEAEKILIEEASKLAVEAVLNIRTIVSLGQEVYRIEVFDRAIDDATKHCLTKIRYRGPVFAMTQVLGNLGFILPFCYGGYLMSQSQIQFAEIIQASQALFFGAFIMTQTFIYAPDLGSALTSARRIFTMIDRKPQIHDPPMTDFNKHWESDGNVTYSNVRFNYPSRPDTTILDGLNFHALKGKSVALVGPSGSGKSTTVQLLLRYYDFEGVIKLDDWTTQELPINVIRRELGMVSQEPVLFDRTIAANIAYGATDREVPMAEIIDVAKQANIHEFIVALPQGYETPLGAQASQLSGGQKQRIAIARALVRNPKILLLDEATSALDNQSEKVVQAALEDAARGRTCITIAHRLTTIRNADLICVLESGKVVESGTHEELMASQGSYARLYDMQQIN